MTCNLQRFVKDGTVAVFLAARHCKNKALKVLLEAGADPNIGTLVRQGHGPVPSSKSL